MEAHDGQGLFCLSFYSQFFEIQFTCNEMHDDEQ